MTRVALALIFVLLAYLGVAFSLQRSVQFPRPPTPPGPSPAEGRADVQIAWIGPEHAVEAWYLPPPAGAARPVPAIVYSHGNGELIDYSLDVFEAPRRWGVGVLLVEYPGYGRSGGSPSEASITATQVDAYDYLAARPEIDSSRIVAYGRSFGGAAACALAKQRKLAALILESTFTSVRPFARRFGVVGPLLLDPFDNLDAVRRFEGPVLVIHGESDEVIPVAHGRELAAATRGSELHILQCGHDCPPPWNLVRPFLARSVQLAP